MLMQLDIVDILVVKAAEVDRRVLAEMEAVAVEEAELIEILDLQPTLEQWYQPDP